ncbi:hypothetical protein KR767_02445 [Luteibacter anthropi]|uniref:S10 family serine carboxypeptidase-like protein n=1 Tax=Luteibacter anthropi TaxID=564369 RepID=UPI002032B165|nr:hypothetical protein [Luteibacter anthropi]URX62950.1 hypothetical protein KR767_02445 [Luteibacter anthropi]
MRLPLSFLMLGLTTFLLPSLACAAVTDLSADAAARAAFAPTQSRPDAGHRRVASDHVLALDGRRIAYRAIVEETTVEGSDGKPAGIAVTYAYVAQGVDAARRPVTFVFNGGPGASSWPLHMEGLGPKVYDAASGTLRDNPASLLDVTDMVFIDPIGTGASFPVEGGDAGSLWNLSGDARFFVGLISDWLHRNGREASPQYLIGESYGTTRALAMLHEDAPYPRLHLSGVALLSMYVGGIDNDDVESMALLPSYAATAWFHHKQGMPAASASEAYDEAWRFARTAYIGALLQGDRLSAADLHEVALATSERTGIPAERLEAMHLRLSPDAFRTGLLSGGKRVGRLDTRMVVDDSLDKLPVPYDDPGMSLGRRPSAVMDDYLRSLGYVPALPYRALNLTINRQWRYGDESHPGSVVQYLAPAMTANPNLRLFTAGGYYDTNTPLEAGRYALSHTGIDMTRWTSKAYPAGHTIGDDPTQRAALATDLRHFIH